MKILSDNVATKLDMSAYKQDMIEIDKKQTRDIKKLKTYLIASFLFNLAFTITLVVFAIK